MDGQEDSKQRSDSTEVAASKGISRRDFLKYAGVAGAAVTIGGGLGGVVAACGSGGTSVSAGAETGREIKVGFVAPLTGKLASFGVPDKYCVDRATKALGDGLVCGDGKKHPVKIFTQDSQSDTNRASQVAGDLISNNEIDILTAASTPDTVSPVADAGETNGVPTITADCPWQAYITARSGGKLDATFKWTYHMFWGLEDVQANFTDMWNQVATNKKVGGLFPNDADGNAWKSGWEPVFAEKGLTATVPSQYQPGTEDYTAQITEFKRAGCEIVMGVMDPPDFTNFWKQATQQGLKVKFATVGKALLFPQSMEALGTIGRGLTTEVWWTPTHPFKSEWLNETPQQFADDFTKTTGKQWTQPLLHFIVFEGVVNTLKRAKDLDDPESILAAVKTMKMETIAGPIDFTSPVVGATPPFKVGPCHIVENVYKTPLVGGQWVQGTTYPFDLKIVSNAGYPGIETQGKVTSL